MTQGKKLILRSGILEWYQVFAKLTVFIFEQNSSSLSRLKSKIWLLSPLVAEDLIAAKSSLQGELRWEFCAPITVLWPERRGDGLLLLPLQLPLGPPPLMAEAKLPAALPSPLVLPTAEIATAVLFPDPFVGYCGKYPPGEGSPSGPKPGLRLRTRSGGLHLWNSNLVISAWALTWSAFGKKIGQFWRDLV